MDNSDNKRRNSVREISRKLINENEEEAEKSQGERMNFIIKSKLKLEQTNLYDDEYDVPNSSTPKSLTGKGNIIFNSISQILDEDGEQDQEIISPSSEKKGESKRRDKRTKSPSIEELQQ